MAEGELTFDDFKELAKNDNLSKYEKIGFPDSYRKGKERAIYEDILAKLPIREGQNKIVIDVGCGCSDLVYYNIEECARHNHHVVLVDSAEMLNNLPDFPHVEKIPGLYPDIKDLNKYLSRIDIAIAYSLMHYVFIQNNMLGFIHKTVDLLRPGGSMLIGDIPNLSKRNRFLQSSEGKAFQANFVAEANVQGATNHSNDAEKIDDAVVLSIIQRFRNFHCETYLMPQSSSLPMSNRREDILITKR